MTVHFAQVASVEGALLFLWDLDEQSSVCANARIGGGVDLSPGKLVRVSYDGRCPVALEGASEDQLTSRQREAMFTPELSAEEEELRRLIWDD